MGVDASLDLARLHASVVRSVTEDTHQGFFLTDVQLRLVLWNRWMEIHSGRGASEVLGRSLLDVYPDVAEREIKDYYQSALEGRVTVLSHALHRFVLALPPADTDAGFAHMPQSGRIDPLIDDGVVIGTATTIEDVSDRIASESALRKQIEAQQLARSIAENALRAKDEFLSTLSHEIRTPLNAVLGWARILIARDEIDRNLLDRALRVIERNASAQARMIDDMLDMARIVAGKVRLEVQPVDLLSVVLAAVDVVMPSANVKQIAICTHLDPTVPRVLGDHDRLQQVVWNLLSNAVKFTESGGSIEVRLEQAGRSVAIIVRDSGQGISADFLPYLFERFRQHDPSSSRRHGGLGLGLALVRELVELHGGTVSVVSDGPNQGSTFTVSLPTAVSPEVRHADMGAGDSTDEMAQSLVGVHILVVDDEPDSRELSVRVLEQSGARVTAVSSSIEALVQLRSFSPEALPHLIVSDIGMPQQDGYDLIRQVRSLEPDRGGRIPAIALTGYATPENVERVLAAGFQMHVSKPMAPAALVSAIAGVIRG